MDGGDGAGEVAVQRTVVCLGRGGGSPEPGVAHAMGHRFQ
jgi:hypothetical protein